MTHAATRRLICMWSSRLAHGETELWMNNIYAAINQLWGKKKLDVTAFQADFDYM